MGANNADFFTGGNFARSGQIGDQGTGFQSNSIKFAGLGTQTNKFGESAGDQPVTADEDKFAGNAGMKIASNGTN